MNGANTMNRLFFPSPGQFSEHIRPWFNRLVIFGAALLVNVILFGLMPFLLTTAPKEYKKEELTTPVNVIRLRQPDDPVKRKTQKPPEPPPERSTPKAQPPKAAPLKLSLPFDINPRLPSAPNSLSLPATSVPQLEGLDDIFTAGDLDSPLTMLVRVPPIYPMSAKNRGIEGWVRVRFIVHEDGSVGSISVSESKPKEIFDAAVIRSVSGWKFKPGTIGGVAVKTWAETVIRFNLD